MLVRIHWSNVLGVKHEHRVSKWYDFEEFMNEWYNPYQECLKLGQDLRLEFKEVQHNVR